MSIEEEIKQIAKEKETRRITRAKNMSGKERFMEGFELYQESLERMKAGIRYRHPEFNEQQVIDKINANMKVIRDAERATYPPELTP